jgi:hypothetical protein
MDFRSKVLDFRAPRDYTLGPPCAKKWPDKAWYADEFEEDRGKGRPLPLQIQ